MNRRELLKVGALALLASMLKPVVFAQSSNVYVSNANTAEPKIDGNISYNAGWVVPLEDKSPLLELEAKKNKEKEDAAKQKADVTLNSQSPKERSKSFSDRMQGLLDKLKNLF